MLTERVQRWREEGAIEEVLGRRLFVRRRGGGEGALLLFLHGFPSSSYDWRPLLELRPPRRGDALPSTSSASASPRSRATTSTRSPGRPTRPRSWCAAPARRRVFVVGHDMGTSVATELMARDLRGELGIER